MSDNDTKPMCGTFVRTPYRDARSILVQAAKAATKAITDPPAGKRFASVNRLEAAALHFAEVVAELPQDERRALAKRHHESKEQP